MKRAAKIPWVEKYRPKKVDDVAHQEEVVRALKKSLDTGNLPHLLLYGPPGTGKTSTALAIGHELYGPELFKTRVMELNASDERGINVIRSKVKSFSQVATAAASYNGRQCPPYKLIILDEADSMTPDAQAALRRIIENYSRVTRFCLICNYVSRIIDPLASRCAKFRFRPLEGDTMGDKLVAICSQENLHITEEALRTVVSISGGDLRKAITTLQSVSSLYDEKEVTEDAIVEVAGVIPPKKVDRLMDACASGSFFRLQSAVTDMTMDGYSSALVLSQMHDRIVDAALSNKQKAEIMKRLAAADQALVDSADEFLQLFDVCAFMMRVYGLKD